MKEARSKTSGNSGKSTSKRTGNGVNMSASPNLIILLSTDAKEWGHYLSECFTDIHRNEADSLVIHQELINNLPCPLTSSLTNHFKKTQAVLVVISPDFLDFVDSHAQEVFEIGKLLNPAQTLAMLCGVHENDISLFHKAALLTYEQWPHLVARDQDKDFVLSVIQKTQEVMFHTRESRALQKPQFKLSPRKVREGTNKVFILLNKPVTDKQKVQILIEGNGVKEVPVKFRNPYTLEFIVPENCMQVSRILNVHMKYDDHLLGVRQLRCDSKMGELYNLLSSVNSPYELLCQTLGVPSRHEVDAYLSSVFRKNMPMKGFSLLELTQDVEKRKSEDDLPTLLHFTARYGLSELASQVLQCPGASLACRLRNTRNLTPAQLANHFGHNDIAAMLEDFQKGIQNGQCEQSRTNQLPVVYESSPDSLYDVPKSVDIENLGLKTLVQEDSDNNYMSMVGHKDNSTDKLEPHHRVVLSIKNDLDCLDNQSSSNVSCCDDVDKEIEMNGTHRDTISNGTITSSQEELPSVIEQCKKEMSPAEMIKACTGCQSSQCDPIKGIKGQSLGSVDKGNQKTGGDKKNFTELRNFISTMFGHKDSNRRKTEFIRPLEEGMRCVEDGSSYRLSTASTTSSSSYSSSGRQSTVSAYDSGTHSDSCEESSRNKEYLSTSKFGSRWAVQSISQRAPAPPPRPPKLPVSRVPSSRKVTQDHTYYTFQSSKSDLQNDNDTAYTEYVMPDSDGYLRPNSILAAANDHKCCTLSEHQLSSTNNQSEMPPSDYDMVPVPRPCEQMCVKGIPSPLTNLKLQHTQKRNNTIADITTHSQMERGKEVLYYDIPAAPIPLMKNSQTCPAISTQGLCINSCCKKAPSSCTLFNGDKADENVEYDVPRLACFQARKGSAPCILYCETPPTKEVDTDEKAEESDYYNICYHSGNSIRVSASRSSSGESQCDSIPDELPPPPPVADEEEEHYKLLPPTRPIPPCVTSEPHATKHQRTQLPVLPSRGHTNASKKFKDLVKKFT